jgi:hypothetical protein
MHVYTHQKGIVSITHTCAYTGDDVSNVLDYVYVDDVVSKCT